MSKGAGISGFSAEPLLARECPIYIYNWALRLGLPVGSRAGRGIESSRSTMKSGRVSSETLSEGRSEFTRRPICPLLVIWS